MNNRQGFTLVEIMITMAIMMVVIALTSQVYMRNVKDIRSLTAGEDSKMDHLMAMETIRLDLQHVGTGIGLNETTAPIVYDETNPALPVLDLRSTLVNTNQTTLGWALINCTVANGAIGAGNYIVDQREVTTNNNLVLLNSAKNYVANTNTAYSCPPAIGLYTAFPNATGTDACATGFCTNIRYNLSAAQPLETCAVGTRNLTRTVGGAIIGDTLINCVAGVRVRFDIDANTDDRISAAETEQTNVPATSGDIMAQVKNIDMYLLVQVGNMDRTLNSAPTLTVDGIDFTGNLAAVTNANNYRWKIFKVSGKPNSWL